VVLTMLPDLPQVEEVLRRDDGLQAGMNQGSVLVVMGTVSPVAVRDLGVRLEPAGVAVVDAPVSGGDVGAEQATLSIMVGGRPEDVTRVRPYLEAMGTTVDHLGPLGAGQLAKACNQIVVAATLTALSEALVLARRGGLDPQRVFAVLGGGLAASRVLEVKGPKLLGGDFRPGGAAAFQHKDLGFALAAAREEGVALPLTALVDQLYGAARWNGFGDDDHSVVVRVIERLAGEPRDG
jgi:2-hydroxy-3-oxopropionate reductase